jgi:hypothetical protein
LTPDDSPPTVVTARNVVNIANYDPSTGVGDIFVTGYIGGSCNGSVFNSQGATKTATASAHFVASDGGKQIDYVNTQLQSVTGNIGDFSIRLHI